MWLVVFLMSFTSRTLEQRLMGEVGKGTFSLELFPVYPGIFSRSQMQPGRALLPNHRSWSTFQPEWTVPVAKCHGLNQEELLHYNQLAIHGTDFISFFSLNLFGLYIMIQARKWSILWQYYKREWEKIFLVKRNDEGKRKKKKKQYG